MKKATQATQPTQPNKAPSKPRATCNYTNNYYGDQACVKTRKR